MCGIPDENLTPSESNDTQCVICGEKDCRMCRVFPDTWAKTLLNRKLKGDNVQEGEEIFLAEFGVTLEKMQKCETSTCKPLKCETIDLTKVPFENLTLSEGCERMFRLPDDELERKIEEARRLQEDTERRIKEKNLQEDTQSPPSESDGSESDDGGDPPHYDERMRVGTQILAIANDHHGIVIKLVDRSRLRYFYSISHKFSNSTYDKTEMFMSNSSIPEKICQDYRRWKCLLE